MLANKNACDPARLKMFLEHQLNEPQTHALEARVVNYGMAPDQERGGDRIRQIQFDATDIPDRDSRVEGVVERQTKGSLQFDSRLGRMQQLELRRQAMDVVESSPFLNPDVIFNLEWLEPEKVNEHNASLSAKANKNKQE